MMSVNCGQVILLLQSAPTRAFILVRKRGHTDTAAVSAPHAAGHRRVTWPQTSQSSGGGGVSVRLPCGSAVKNAPAVQEAQVRSLGWEDPRRRERLPTPVFWPGGLQYRWRCSAFAPSPKGRRNQRGMGWGRMETGRSPEKCFQDCLSGQGQTRYPQICLTAETNLD